MLILIFLLTVRAEAKINPQGPTVVRDFTNCVSEIINNSFNKSGLVVFANTKNVSTSVAWIREGLFKEIHKKLNYSVEVKSPKDELATCAGDEDENDLTVIHMDQFEATPVADYYIVIVDKYHDFTLVASRIIRSRAWNPHAKFIILFFHFAATLKSNKSLAEKFLSCMFQHNVINIVVVVPDVSNVRNAVVYSWRPFDPPRYCGYFNETAKNRLLVENTCAGGILKQRKNMFADRIPRSMKGCVLQILAIERQPFIGGGEDDPNIERLFINQLADLYGFKTEYTIIQEFRGERNDLGDWDGVLKELSAKKGHILLGGIFPDFEVHEDFECSATYLADSYTLISPRALKSPKWLALFIVFQRTVWYCVIAAFILCGISWKVIGHLSNESLYHRTLRHCLLSTWISHVGFCAYARPVFVSLRVFYVFFNIYCILFLTAYQTKLFHVLKEPAYEEQIDTLEELIESGIKIGGFEELHDIFLNSSDPYDFFIGDNWVDIDNMTAALIDVAVHRNFSVLCSRLELAHLTSVVPELIDSSGDNRYFEFPGSMFSAPMEMVSLRGFAFMRHFSTALERVKQSGVNSGVRRSFAQLIARRRARLLRAMTPPAGPGPLSMQHLQGGFLALALGYTGGAAILILELIFNTKYVKHKFLECRKRFKRH